MSWLNHSFASGALLAKLASARRRQSVCCRSTVCARIRDRDYSSMFVTSSSTVSFPDNVISCTNKQPNILDCVIHQSVMRCMRSQPTIGNSSARTRLLFLFRKLCFCVQHIPKMGVPFHNDTSTFVRAHWAAPTHKYRT